MNKKRIMEENGDYTLQNIIASKKHHLLKNDGQNILIFGDEKAVERLATTNVIHADGTFTCVIDGFSQLYIFHATAENNVSLPVLFCLVNGKNEQTYTKLLGLVEELATEAGLHIFDREVQLMCDFEMALIKAVKKLYPSVDVKCCFFHFTQSVFRNSVDLLNAIKNTEGEFSEKYRAALRMQWRLMRLPLVPEELITPELVHFIIGASFHDAENLPESVKDIRSYVLRTYVGRRRQADGTIAKARFPPSLWCVRGMSVRINNGAESLHSNVKHVSKGRLFFHFLAIIEGRMVKARDRIATGCQPTPGTASPGENVLLSAELEKLVNWRQGVLNFSRQLCVNCRDGKTGRCPKLHPSRRLLVARCPMVVDQSGRHFRSSKELTFIAASYWSIGGK